MTVIYELDRAPAYLVIRDVQTREVLWQGLPCGRRVEELLAIPDTDDAIVLLEYPPGFGSDANLARVDRGGSGVWQIAPDPVATEAGDPIPTPEGPSVDRGDAFVAISYADNRLSANTYSGYVLTVDPESGDTISSQFVK